jgi:hypothetical protein
MLRGYKEWKEVRQEEPRRGGLPHHLPLPQRSTTTLYLVVGIPKVRAATGACLGELKLRDHPTLAGLHYFLAKPQTRSIPNTLASQLEALSEALDPALAEPEATVQLNASRTIVFRDLDVRFSHSTRQGLDFLRKSQCLTKLDAELLSRLADADDDLSRCDMARKYPESAARAQGWVRDFACRFTRRAIGVRVRATRDAAVLSDFELLSAGNPPLLHQAIKQLDMLLNEGDRFTVSSNTTFGEPQSPIERRAVLHTESPSEGPSEGLATRG